MSLKEIREAIKGIMETIPGIGKVYDYIPYSADWSNFINNFKSNGTIKGWTITRRETAEVPTSIEGVNDRDHLMFLQGYRAHDETTESEKVFQDHVDEVCSKLREKYTLNGKALKVEPPQVIVVEHKMFGSVLCHYAEINLTVKERVIF